MKAFLFLSCVGVLIGLNVDLTLAFALALGQVCPPPEVLSPCVCDESRPGPSINCDNIRGSFNLKQILDRASAYVDEDFIFQRLSIRDTPLVEIGEGAVDHLKFQFVYIGFNERLSYISPGAFNASRKVTKRIDLWMNAIGNEPPFERDIFDFVSSFENLEVVWMPLNRLSSVPDHAFQNLYSLNQIYLGSNSITKIGGRAFAGAPKLKFLWMTMNPTPAIGFFPDTFEGISTLAAVDLTYNKMTYMEQSSFQPLLNRAAKVEVACGEGNYCTRDRFECDQRADWICENSEAYRNKLGGFLCKSGSGYEDIWEYCRRKSRTD